MTSAPQAAIDSIEVSESEVMNGIDEQINYWVSLAVGEVITDEFGSLHAEWLEAVALCC